MNPRIGIDIVNIPGFMKRVKDEALLKRLFTGGELTRARGSVETLAGMFAAKEAYFKAVKMTPDWQQVQVGHNADGAPYLQTRESTSVSISHDGAYTVAVVIVDRSKEDGTM